MLKDVFDKNSQTTNDTVQPETTHARTSDPLDNEPPRITTPVNPGVDVLKLLSELEQMVENAPRGPFGILWRFDEEKFHHTLMKVRAHMPEEIKRASRYLRESERIAQEAKELSERLREDSHRAAKAEMERARGEATHLVQQAENEAEVIVQDAREQAMQMMDNAEAQAKQAITESEIMRRAEIQSYSMLAKTTQDCEAMRQEAGRIAEETKAGADIYAHNVLYKMERFLGGALNEVQRGLDELQHRGTSTE